MCPKGREGSTPFSGTRFLPCEMELGRLRHFWVVHENVHGACFMTETKRRMTCPECLRAFSFDSRLAGSVRPCPACNASIVLGRREDSPPKESPLHPPVQPIQQPIPQQVVYVQDNSTSNAIAAVANFFIPGLGHLVQGRFLMAAGIFIALLCCIPLVLACGFGIALGLLIWAASIYDAATFQPDQKRLIG